MFDDSFETFRSFKSNLGISSLISLNSRSHLIIKAWFPPMRLRYSHICSYENKFNLIGGNALDNFKKYNLTIFLEIIRLFS